MYLHRQSEKDLLNSNVSPICPYNIVNVGPLATEIISFIVWGTPANFNGFRVLSSLLHGTPAVASAKHCGVGRAAITLGIGPHSSCGNFAYFGQTLVAMATSLRPVQTAMTSLDWLTTKTPCYK